MKFLVGTKQEMTQIFDDHGVVHPATLIRVSPAVVTQVKTKDVDGYTAVQVGYDIRKEKNVNNAQKSKGMFAGFMEFPVTDPAELPLGTMIDAAAFASGDTVTVSGTSKSKGFQGVVKRHGFKGGRRTHGQKHSEREPGSIGAGGVQRVMKGRRMGGRMGGDRITVKNLKVLLVDVANGQIFISGAVPGRRGTVVEVIAQ
ncbi:50S ribosomal protein L3 [Candidatus Campbellbacteria bacterium]|nr:MAG: 50S ribosomal protein L3 [Candidatus Campbellbacteria bacterium]